jgi:SAM-dependent methyltransferase
MAMRDLARQIFPGRWFFTLAYWRGWAPWDTGITPPELVRVVEGERPERRPPGRALDLGCGTGTNSLYLAGHGWDVTGIDFAAPAIARAQAKAARAGQLTGAVRFLRGDATRLEALDLASPYDLVLDVGCFHGVEAAARPRYAEGVERLARPEALLLIYALKPTRLGYTQVGITAEEVDALFNPAWRVERVEEGEGPGGRAAAWYWLQRVG